MNMFLKQFFHFYFPADSRVPKKIAVCFLKVLLIGILLSEGIRDAAQQPPHSGTFTVVPLGVEGGLDESNLSAYMLAVKGTSDYVCLDAGTLYDGIQKAVDAGIFQQPVKTVLRDDIKGYLISHAHLDHVSGLILNSPEDTAKNIYGLPYCLNILQSNYFTWKTWANFTDAGDTPRLNKYHYVVMKEGIEIPLAGTKMFASAYPLSHGNPYQSTAFLVRYNQSYLLYLGDTGADAVEKSDKLHLLWQRIVPLIRSGALKGIFIEVSFPDTQPVSLLFGHLTPHLLFRELTELAALSGLSNLKNIPVVITHLKPSGNNVPIIKSELKKNNGLSLNLVFPEQGEKLFF